MPNRLIRDTVILCKTEGASYGVDAAPTGAADTMMVSNLSITPLNGTFVDRDVIRSYLGGSEQLPGTRYIEMGFDVEITGTASAGAAPKWLAPMIGCGYTGTQSTTVRYDITPVSAPGSVTIYWYDSGLLHKATGCRGTGTMTWGVNAIPKASFRFTGIYSTPTVATPTGMDYTAWKQPQVVMDANTGSLSFGGTHALAPTAPAIGGSPTVYPSQGLELDLGNTVNFTPLLDAETVDLTQRAVTGRVTLDLTAAEERTLMQSVEGATTQSLALLHGTRANEKVLIWMPSVQLINPSKAESNGKRLVSFDLRVLPGTTGNDELRLVTSFA